MENSLYKWRLSPTIRYPQCVFSNSAFTLVELLVVVALMGIAVTTVTLRLDSVSQRGRLQAALRQIASVHSLARLEAITTGQPRRIRYRLGANHAIIERPAMVGGQWKWVGGPPTVLSHLKSTVIMTVKTSSGPPTPSDKDAFVRIRSDGAVSGYVVVMTTGSSSYAAVAIDGVTGRGRTFLDLSRQVAEHPLSLLERQP